MCPLDAILSHLLCNSPQQNVLFPALTVMEHLHFFGMVKGRCGTELEAAARRVAERVGLTEKVHVLSSALSGGMKRKLCLAIALIGDPLLLLLDEPTSGWVMLFIAYQPLYVCVCGSGFSFLSFSSDAHHGRFAMAVLARVCGVRVWVILRVAWILTVGALHGSCCRPAKLGG